MELPSVAAGVITFAALLSVDTLSEKLNPPPIQVHSIAYVAGEMHQDRTVTAEGEFFPARWEAYIIDADTKKAVEQCSGTGFWPYETGRITAEMSLQEWTNNDECTVEFLRELGGEFYPVASWRWGNDSTSKQGAPFTP